MGVIIPILLFVCLATLVLAAPRLPALREQRRTRAIGNVLISCHGFTARPSFTASRIALPGPPFHYGSAQRLTDQVAGTLEGLPVTSAGYSCRYNGSSHFYGIALVTLPLPVDAAEVRHEPPSTPSGSWSRSRTAASRPAWRGSTRTTRPTVAMRTTARARCRLPGWVNCSPPRSRSAGGPTERSCCSGAPEAGHPPHHSSAVSGPRPLPSPQVWETAQEFSSFGQPGRPPPRAGGEAGRFRQGAAGFGRILARVSA